MEYETKKIGPLVAETRITGLTADSEAGILYMSDLHWDAKACNRKLLTSHLDVAKDNGWPVVIVGDIFDAMQGKFDPRRSMDELRPEFQRDDYFDVVVKAATDWFAPWAKTIHIASYGNHETSIKRHNNTDLLERWIYGMRNEHDSPVVKGGYGTWHLLRFMQSKKVGVTLKARYYHGKGGGAPVTLGTIQTNRQAAYLDDVDIVVNGHNHHGYVVALPKLSVTSMGKVQKGMTYFLRTPGYKESGIHDEIGFDVEKGSPKPNGAVAMKFKTTGNGSYGSRLVLEAVTMFR